MKRATDGITATKAQPTRYGLLILHNKAVQPLIQCKVRIAGIILSSVFHIVNKKVKINFDSLLTFYVVLANKNMILF